MKKYILKIDCNDEKGLIYRIADTVFKFNLNIAKNHEFVDHGVGRFFFRAEIDADEKLDVAGFCGSLNAMLGGKANISFKEAKKKNIIVLATKETHCLGDLLIKNQSGEINANILAVIANHDDLQSLVEKFEIPFFCVKAGGIEREKHEKMVLEVMSKFDFSPRPRASRSSPRSTRSRSTRACGSSRAAPSRSCSPSAAGTTERSRSPAAPSSPTTSTIASGRPTAALSASRRRWSALRER